MRKHLQLDKEKISFFYDQISKEDYRPEDNIFLDGEEAEINRIKAIIEKKLGSWDRRLFLLYTENQSLRKTATQIGCSHMKVSAEIKRIKKIILKELKNGSKF